MKHKTPFFLLIFAILSNFLAFANSSKWEIVTSGAPVISPFKTSYGFSFFNDGRMVVSFSNSGTKLYERRLSEKPSELVTCTQTDFFYVVSESKKNLTLYNPDGIALWTKELSTEIISKPLIGYDGRVFVHSETEAFCFGLNGKLKWKVDFSEKLSTKSNTMNDGSILFFYKAETDKKTKAIRVSPYGQQLEDVTFAGIVVDSIQNEDGLFLLFSEGTLGFCSVNNQNIKSAWTIQNVLNTSSADSIKKSKLCNFKNFLFVISSKGDFSLINTKTKNVVFSQKDKNIQTYKEEDLQVFFDSQKIVILSKNQKSIYVTATNYLGDVLFTFEEPISDNAFAFYTKSGFVVVLESDWCVKGFLPYQSVFNSTTTESAKRKNYPVFNDSFEKTTTSLFKSILASENYSTKEEKILIYIASQIEDYVQQQNTIDFSGNYGTANAYSLQSIIDAINLASLSEVDFSSNIANVLNSTKDTAVLKAAFYYASKNGYDPNHSMINAIENLYFSSFSNNPDDSFYLGLCDSVYNICKTMGSPVLFNQGKRILTKLLTSNFNNKVKNYILQTISNIISLQI